MASVTENSSARVTAARPTRSAVDASRNELQARAAALLQQDLSFIPNELFRERTAKRKILGQKLDLDFAPELQLASGSKLPSHLARLCEAPLLQNEEEKTLFCRMNYLI